MKPLQNGDFGLFFVISHRDIIPASGLDRDLEFSVNDPYDLPESSLSPHDKFSKQRSHNFSKMVLKIKFAIKTRRYGSQSPTCFPTKYL